MSDLESDEDRELDAALAGLPAHDVNEWKRAQLKRRALEVLARQGGPAWLRALERTYGWVLEPALVFGVAPLYLIWAFATVVGIYQVGGH